MLTRLSSSLKPTLRFLVPAQTVCNYATLWFRNAASLLSDGDPNGTWQRFMVVAAPTQRSSNVFGPNNEGCRRTRSPTGPRSRTTRTWTRTRTPPHRGRRTSARRATRGYARHRARWPGTCPETRARRTSAAERRLGHGDGAMRTRPGSGRFTPVQAGLIALVVILIVTFLAFTKDIPFTKPYELKARFTNAPPMHEGPGRADRRRGRGPGLEDRARGRRLARDPVTMELQDKALPIHRTPDQDPSELFSRATSSSRCSRASRTRAERRHRGHDPGHPDKRARADRPGAGVRCRRTRASNLQTLVEGLRRCAQREAAARRGPRPGWPAVRAASPPPRRSTSTRPPCRRRCAARRW